MLGAQCPLGLLLTHFNLALAQTFLSSSLLAGDRSLVNVVAHEIAHSWAGNLVTNSNWNDFMMNEGFCVYLERLILAKVDERGFDYRNFEMLLGYYDLIKTCNDDLREQPKFTKLVPDLTGIDPDEAFSKIPYEKGRCAIHLFNRVLSCPIVNSNFTLNSKVCYYITWKLKLVAMRLCSSG